MKVEDIIGAVLLKISGGRVSSDLSVTPHDVLTYIPDGVNALMLKYYSGERQIVSNKRANPLFLQIFTLQPTLVDGKFVVELEERALSLPDAESIYGVTSKSGLSYERFYPEDGLLRTFFIQTNRDKRAFSVEGDSVVLYNHIGGDVKVKQVVHIDEYDMEDEIFVPSGSEIELIDLVYTMITDQRMNPADGTIDGRDIQ